MISFRGVNVLGIIIYNNCYYCLIIKLLLSNSLKIILLKFFLLYNSISWTLISNFDKIFVLII